MNKTEAQISVRGLTVAYGDFVLLKNADFDDITLNSDRCGCLIAAGRLIFTAAARCEAANDKSKGHKDGK